MPKLSEYDENKFIKMLLIGDSGNGKTGALASIVNAGFKLFVLDFDNGLEPLQQFVDKDKQENLIYEPLHDELHAVGGKMLPKGTPRAFAKSLDLLTKWKTEDGDFGSPSKFGRDTFVVIDSLTHMCNAALRYVQVLNNNGGGKITQPEWGEAQRLVEGVLSLLYSTNFQTNVVITAHIAYVQSADQQDDKGNPDGEIRGLPMALGQKLPPKIPSYFNHMLLMEKRGSGIATKRYLTTTPNGVISTKSPVEGIPRELPIETGLATYIKTALKN